MIIISSIVVETKFGTNRMALRRCLQKKGLKRRLYRNRYKDQKAQVKKKFRPYSWSSLLSKSRIYLSYLGSLLLNWISFFICLIYELLRLIPLWIVEQFRFCPQKRRFEKAEDFLIIGHRGAAAHEVENTLPALEAALQEYGANALEIDLSFTKDKHVVLWHDWDPDSIVAMVRQAGLEPDVKYRPFVPMNGGMRRPIHKLTLSELRDNYGYTLKNRYAQKIDISIPTFQEFLAWASAEESLKYVFLDIKTPRTNQDLIPDIVQNINLLRDQFQPRFEIIFLTPDEVILKALKNAAPKINASFDMEMPLGIVLDPEIFSAIQKAIDLHNQTASIGRPTVLQLGPWTTYRRTIAYDLLLKKKYNENSTVLIKPFIGWTVNKRREMKCLIKMGMDGILTDRPDRLSKIWKGV